MAQTENILQELSDLESMLVNVPSRDVYQAPAGYFEDLAGVVMSRIRAMETENAREELAFLSPVLSSLNRATPYGIPAGYFDGLEKRLADSLRQERDQTPQEELQHLSPLLNSLKKQMPYRVPEGYFDNLAPVKARAKVIPVNASRWFRYAAAAAIITLVATGGFLFLDKNEKTDPNEKSYVWVKENMNKVSTDELDEFITIVDKEALVAIASNGTDEIRELMKNISDKEIQDFVTDTEIIATDADEGILLN